MTIPKDLLTVDEMGRAEAAGVAAGVQSIELMEAAGKAVADAVMRDIPDGRIAVLCGPGNNGGDGFVAARYLTEAGRTVRLALLGDRDRLTGDARHNADRWVGAIEALSPDVLKDSEGVVDAIFGAGLSRAIDGAARETVQAIGDRPCIAVDVPSGVHGDTGEILGAAPKATRTVTFFRAKPGHLLLPGRIHSGELEVVDIGIPETVLDQLDPRQFRNDPALWIDRYPWPKLEDHKYSRGHAVVVGGAFMTGAARLAARGALRAGAGIVSAAVPSESTTIYRVALPGVLIHGVRDTGTFREVIEEPRVAACLVGPGNGVNAATREKALAVLRLKLPAVIDADALSVFEDARELFFSSIESACILTPHEGEFRRLFDETAEGKLERTRAAAARTGAVVLLKGADTVIAAPDGRAVVNDNAPPELAVAGAGDVLAGFALGLLAQGVDPFDAACMAAWLHGAAAASFGPGLIAEDLPDLLPGVLRSLKEYQNTMAR